MLQSAAAAQEHSIKKRNSPIAANNITKNNSMKQNSVRKSSIVAIDESGQSMVDFDLSESKFTVGGFLNTGESPHDNDKSVVAFSKQGSDS